MACESNKLRLHAYFDGELDLVHSLEIEQHLKSCAECAQELREQQTVRRAFRSAGVYYRAPQAVRAKMLAAAGSVPGVWDAKESKDRIVMRSARRQPLVEWLAVAAAIAVVVLVGWKIVPGARSDRQEALIAQEIVASHIRSLQPGHLYDVESTDQHTVKPWFDGKLDFAPPVRDLAEQGFVLVGGRLDYIGNRAVAALVYQRRKHVINLYVWPESSTESGRPDGLERREMLAGYNLIEWRDGGMHFVAVSDVNADDLSQFMQLLH